MRSPPRHRASALARHFAREQLEKCRRGTDRTVPNGMILSRSEAVAVVIGFLRAEL